MTQNKKILKIGLALSLFLIASQAKAYEMDWKTSFCANLNKISQKKLVSKLKPDYAAGLVTQALSYSSATAMPAILQIWLNEDENIELFWWRQENREVRCFVISLYLCSTVEPVSWIPDFSRYLDFFNESEKENRMQEMQFILDHRSAIAGLIAAGIKNLDPSKYDLKFIRYYGSMEKEKIGTKLPSWCK